MCQQNRLRKILRPHERFSHFVTCAELFNTGGIEADTGPQRISQPEDVMAEICKKLSVVPQVHIIFICINIKYSYFAALLRKANLVGIQPPFATEGEVKARLQLP